MQKRRQIERAHSRMTELVVLTPSLEKIRGKLLSHNHVVLVSGNSLIHASVNRGIAVASKSHRKKDFQPVNFQFRHKSVHNRITTEVTCFTTPFALTFAA